MDTTTGTRDDTGSPTAVETVRWVSARPGGLVIERGERPRPGPGQARVRSVLVGICGSDLHAVAGRHPFVPLPYRPGHEVVGVVEEIGGDVHLAVSAGVAGRFGPGRVRVGDRVVVEPTLNCGDCKQCRRGVVNLCERLDFFGCGHSQGGMAEEFVVRTDRLHVVPPEMSDLQAALVEPLSTPVHAVRLAAGAGAEEEADLSGRSVVVLGAGTIGLLVLAAARWPAPRTSWSPTSCPPSGSGPRGSAPLPSWTRPRTTSSTGSVTLSGRAPTWCSTASACRPPSTRRSGWRSRAGPSSWSACRRPR